MWLALNSRRCRDRVDLALRSYVRKRLTALNDQHYED